MIGGAGLAGLGVSGVTGLLALGKKGDLEEMCPVPARCTPEGSALADEGSALTTASTISFFVGLAAVGAGTALVLTAKDGTTAALAPRVAAGEGGLSVSGRF